MIEHDGGAEARTGSGWVHDEGERPRRWIANRPVVAFAVLTMILGVWGAWSWSLIPLDVHGRIDKIEYQSESDYRWRILELEDGRSFVIDRRITAQLGDWQELRGQRVDTDFGAGTLRVGDQTAHLAPSVEFWKMVVVFAAFVVVVLARSHLATRTSVPEPRPEVRRRGP